VSRGSIYESRSFSPGISNSQKRRDSMRGIRLSTFRVGKSEVGLGHGKKGKGDHRRLSRDVSRVTLSACLPMVPNQSLTKHARAPLSVSGSLSFFCRAGRLDRDVVWITLFASPSITLPQSPSSNHPPPITHPPSTQPHAIP